jgi:hypothetical protein
VDELHRHRGAQQRLGVARPGARRDEHQQRPQALAARGDRRPRVLGQHRAVRAGDRQQSLLEPPHQLGHVRAAGLDDRGDRLGARH